MLVIPIFIPHAGCPHDCCFCNQRIISGRLSVPDSASIVEEIEKYRDIALYYDIVQLAFYGGSFTAIPADLRRIYLECAQPYLRKNGGFIDTLRLSTRPDYIDKYVLDELKVYGVSIVELGAQSMDDGVLIKSGRGHCACDTEKASALIKENGFTLGLQTMTGLPGASAETDIATAYKIAKLHPRFVRIYPTVVVKETRLYKMLNSGEYIPPALEDTVELCAVLVSIYRKAGIKVVRLGLQASDNINTSGDIAAGPYHPAFGQLVYSRMALKNIIAELYKTDNVLFDSKLRRLLVSVPKGRLSTYVGQRKSNITILKREYAFNEVNIIEDDELHDDSIRLDIKPL